MYCVSASRNSSRLSLEEAIEKAKHCKKVAKSRGATATLEFRDSHEVICKSTPTILPNWRIREGKGGKGGRVEWWEPTGTFDRYGRQGHVSRADYISWYFVDRLGNYHVGTKSTHLMLCLKHKYATPPGMSFPTQSKEEIDRLISTSCSSALKSHDSSDSSESKDYSTPHFTSSMNYIERLSVEEPDLWQLYYDESKRMTSLIRLESSPDQSSLIKLIWFYRHDGKLYVGNNTHHFRLMKSKRAFYLDSAGRKIALQDDVEVKVALVALKRAT